MGQLEARAVRGRAPSRNAASISSEDLHAVNQQAAAFFRDRFVGSWAPSYLQQRVLSAAATDAWGAGYAPASWTALTDHLRAAGWDDAVLQASGLSRRARTGNLIDHFRDRLVLPISDSRRHGEGRVVAFIGRAAPGAREGVPKYLNSPRTAFYDKRAVLFGLSDGLAHLQGGGTPVLVEGPMDAIAVTTATRGRYVGLAPCGTSLTDAHVRRLAETVDVAARGVVVATDSDTAGVAAAVRAYDQLSPLTHRLLRADLPDGTDPADLLQHHGAETLSAALNEGAHPLLDAVLDARLQAWTPQLQWVEGRVGAARDVARLVAPLPPALRQRYAARLTDRLDLDPTTFTQILGTASASLKTTSPSGSSPPQRTGAALTLNVDVPPSQSVRTPSSTPPAPAPAIHSRQRR